MEKKNVWETYDENQLQELEQHAKEYMDFLDNGKTERECIDLIVNKIEQEGYRELQVLIKENQPLKKGDKVYAVWMNKSIVMFQIGEKPMEEGMNILGAHIDSPRLDVKQNPMYEEGGFAYLDTHYYGGVKKYQWVTIPLAIHGVVMKKDGTTIEINVGDHEDDPVFFVSDLLIHLAAEQLEKKASKVIEGLGEADEYFESESCAFEGLDKVYTYPGFKLNTYPDGDKDYVLSVVFMDDTVSTDKGISIGSTKDEVTDAYGEASEESAAKLVYESGDTELAIGLNGDSVSSVEISAVVEE